MAGAGLTGGGSGEATTADGGGGAVVHDAFEQRLGEVGGARVHDLLGLGRVVGDDVPVRVADGGEHPGIEVDAAIGEDGVGAGHVDRGGVVGADGDGGSAARSGDAGGTGECGDVVEADHLAELRWWRC